MLSLVVMRLGGTRHVKQPVISTRQHAVVIQYGCCYYYYDDYYGQLLLWAAEHGDDDSILNSWSLAATPWQWDSCFESMLDRPAVF